MPLPLPSAGEGPVPTRAGCGPHDPSPAGSPPWVTAAQRQLEMEVAVMLRHALANGCALPASLGPAIDMQALARSESGQAIATLAALHGDLCEIVSPARPGTLRLLQASLQQGGLASVLGPVANVRRLTVAALVCVVCFVGLSMSPEIDGKALVGNVYELSGLQQLLVLLFLLAAAGMGSTFQALFTAQSFVSNATYDPVYDTSYWIRIGLGLVAGLMLAVLIPLEPQHSQSIERPVLALLGGFSVKLVHMILQRLVDAVGFMFEGNRQLPGRSPPPADGAQGTVSPSRIA